MTREELIRELFKGRKLYKELPECVEIEPNRQNVYSYLTNSDLKLSALVKMCDYLNYEIVIIKGDGELIDLSQFSKE